MLNVCFSIKSLNSIVRLSGVEAHVPIGAPFDFAQGDKDCGYYYDYYDYYDYYENEYPSPDRSGNPFYFFL